MVFHNIIPNLDYLQREWWPTWFPAHLNSFNGVCFPSVLRVLRKPNSARLLEVTIFLRQKYWDRRTRLLLQRRFRLG